MDKEKCGKYIREKREALGLTKEELAEKLNVGAYDVDCWEAGFFPSAEFLLPLSDALHIDVEELLSGEDLAEKDSAAPVSPASSPEVPSTSSPTAAPAEKSYYEELREEMNDTDWGNVEVSPSGENGFSVGERIFGKILCICFIVVILIIQGTHFFEYLNRERELTLENYREYIEISVYASDGAATGNSTVFNPDEYTVRITAREDIGEFSVAIEVTFRNILYEDIVRTVNIGGESLSEGNTVEETLSFDTVVMETGYEVISVEGKLP